MSGARWRANTSICARRPPSARERMGLELELRWSAKLTAFPVLSELFNHTSISPITERPTLSLDAVMRLDEDGG